MTTNQFDDIQAFKGIGTVYILKAAPNSDKEVHVLIVGSSIEKVKLACDILSPFSSKPEKPFDPKIVERVVITRQKDFQS